MIQIAGSARCGGIAVIGVGHVSRLSSCSGRARSAGASPVDGSGILKVMHDDVTRQAHAAIVARDWAVLRPLLHPYLVALLSAACSGSDAASGSRSSGPSPYRVSLLS